MVRRLLAFPLVILVVCLGSVDFTSAADPQHSASPRRIGVLLVGWSPERKEVADLVESKVDVIVLETTLAAQTAKG